MLEVRYQDYPLIGNYKGCCHIRPDVVLIYKKEDILSLPLYRSRAQRIILKSIKKNFQNAFGFSAEPVAYLRFFRRFRHGEYDCASLARFAFGAHRSAERTHNAFYDR